MPVVLQGFCLLRRAIDAHEGTRSP
uniref:Uncharacterized protein n=1 Tax=Arundo donax TaxID=35708 RepID=A0A0A9B9L7_ARUDO